MRRSILDYIIQALKYGINYKDPIEEVEEVEDIKEITIATGAITGEEPDIEWLYVINTEEDNECPPF